MIILDSLEAAEKAATAGPWYSSTDHLIAVWRLDAMGSRPKLVGTLDHWEDADATALLRNYAADLIAVAKWARDYSNATDWHAYVGTEGGRIDPELDALLAPLTEGSDE